MIDIFHITNLKCSLMTKKLKAIIGEINIIKKVKISAQSANHLI